MRALFAALLLGLTVAVQADSFNRVVRHEWEEFKFSHNKTYDGDDEEAYRLKVFVENNLKIVEHNNRFAQGLESFIMKINRFSDMTSQEVVNTMNGFLGNPNGKREGATFIGVDDDVPLPETVDWREKGAVTPVKDQGRCGSCWAFSATGGLEGQHFRKTGKLVSLSEQNLMDCSRSYGNGGCYGGAIDVSFKYIKENGGIDTEESYPYTGKHHSCAFKRADVGADDVGFVDLPFGNEDALKKAVATIGPISTAVDASLATFHLYDKGIYAAKSCSILTLDHSVLVVGYGSEGGKDYWLVKNSWGKPWGEKGYIKMARNMDNMCGISSAASYPLV
uniref:Cathepsin L1-like n=2 Tax=Hirondellea gigas TaxID=1518452 RepID=A0A6A7G926_9CRUS